MIVMIRAILLSCWVFRMVVGFAFGAEPAIAQSVNEYRIGPEDVLDIAIWKNAELTRTVPVRPDGMISLPLINDVRAVGLTPLELRDVLIKKLEEYIPSPQVSVIVSAVHSFKVSVIGEVGFPGRHEIRSGTTVLDALAMSGGLKEFAARGRIVVMRQDGKGGTKRISFNYDKAIAEGGEAENFSLRPGDIVVAP
jgi:polysaccharide biosynthesis/export protein